MAEYKLEVVTGERAFAATFDRILITLLGSQGQSETTDLNNWGVNFMTETANWDVHHSNQFVSGECSLGEGGEKPTFSLPRKPVVLLEDNPMKAFEDEHPLLIEHSKNELASKKCFFRWTSINEKLPHHSDFTVSNVPADARMSISRFLESKKALYVGILEVMLKGMLTSEENWQSLEDIKRIFWTRKTQISDYVSEHWKEDDFYGAQFLNGVNPCSIKRCSELPSNFPVSEESVKPFLEDGSTLANEIKMGNIFLYDQKILSGIPGKLYHGEELQVPAPLCLLYVNPEKKLVPIAIQVHQEPSEENPIFLPSDSETDWLLAKIFVKNANMVTHQAISHLKNTHFLSEVWAMSLFRNISAIHPIHKLLIPHFR
ncbi:arachidonate 12-lipoxygenase, 12R-type-like [Syngnathus scovelli]|uniref:arachidonate 12-lipoxygenase, 12R-type-like n=1 Tax=Syngnathus scovelli TaxID=161590 RepID=UPI0035CC433D